MRLFFLYITLVCCCFGADFITKTEYAKMLYSNPRGIGCDRCHGANGEGISISKFKERVKKTKEITQKELISPRINNVDFKTFVKALTEPKNVMPTYFLTDEEMIILYEYVINLDKGKK